MRLQIWRLANINLTVFAGLQQNDTGDERACHVQYLSLLLLLISIVI